jgi:hypothetical protein
MTFYVCIGGIVIKKIESRKTVMKLASTILKRMGARRCEMLSLMK